MSNNNCNIICDTLKNTGWLSKQPISIFKVILNGDGSNGGALFFYDGDENTGELKLIVRSPAWQTWQVDIPRGLKFKRGCFVKLNAYATTPIVCFKYE